MSQNARVCYSFLRQFKSLSIFDGETIFSKKGFPENETELLKPSVFLYLEISTNKFKPSNLKSHFFGNVDIPFINGYHTSHLVHELHCKKVKFSIKDFFNVTKSAGKDLFTFTEEILNEKLHFLPSAGA